MTKLLRNPLVIASLLATLQPSGMHAMFTPPSKEQLNNYGEYIFKVLGNFQAFDESDESTLALHNLFWLIRDQKIEEISKLLDKNKDLITLKDSVTEDTVLHIATETGNSEIIKLLIAKGADVNAKNRVFGPLGKWVKVTPLHMAVQKGLLEVVKILLEHGADSEIKNHDGLTALHLAILHKQPAIFKHLVKKGANIHTKERMFGSTTLHIAAEVNNIEIIEFLLDKGFDINAKNSSGMTALLYAAKLGHLDLIKFLIDNGADINATNNTNMSALQIAASDGQTTMVKFLLDKGLKIDAKSDNGITALMLATFVQNIEMVKFLLANGANVNESDSEGLTALHIASDNNNLEMMELLVEHGAIACKGTKNKSVALNFTLGSKTLACTNYLVLVRAFDLTSLGHVAFDEFATYYLTNKQNIAHVQKLLPLDKKKNFTNKFNEWCKDHKQTNNPVNTNSNTITTTPNGLTNTNLCATTSQLFNKK